MPNDLCCPILELRQYTLHPGRRDALISLFDREFIETQEAVGMRIVGQFRDEAAPDRFVWIRGFADMSTRAEALGAFYGGPVWKRHRDEANATMVDSDDVLLLRPVDEGAGFALPGLGAAPEDLDRPSAESAETHGSVLTATIYHPLDDDFVKFFEESAEAVLVEAGAPPVARLRTEHSENTFPALPVRTGENVFVRIARFDSPAKHAEHRDRLSRSAEWSETVRPQLLERLSAPPTQLTLTPTARSLLR